MATYDPSARPFIHLLTLLPPFLFSPLCVLLIYRAAGKCLRHSPSIVQPSLSLSLSRTPSHLSFLPSFSTSSISPPPPSASCAVSCSPSLSLSRRSLFPVQPLGQPTSDILTDSDHSDVRGRREWGGGGGGVVQPIDGNLGNTAEVTYRGITRGNALKKSVKGEGVDRRVASIGASSCTHDNMIRVHGGHSNSPSKALLFFLSFFFSRQGKSSCGFLELGLVGESRIEEEDTFVEEIFFVLSRANNIFISVIRNRIMLIARV